MSGQRPAQSIISSLRRYSGYLTSGLSFLKSNSTLLFQIMNTSNRVAFGCVAGAGDVGVKLAAW
jgi:hypothetical protein